MSSASDGGAATDASAERLYAANLGALDLFSILIGDRLGYYQTLAHHGPQSP